MKLIIPVILSLTTRYSLFLAYEQAFANLYILVLLQDGVTANVRMEMVHKITMQQFSVVTTVKEDFVSSLILSGVPIK